jgi:long-chain acyl-CoA synthetase
MELKRLFDCVTHQLTHFPKENMLAAKINGAWQQYSTLEVQKDVNALSAGLLQKGYSGNDMTVEGADKIAIISNNRPEWIFTDLAVQQIGAILVPIYPTTNPIELEFILKDSAAKIIFVSNKELFDKVQDVCDRLPLLKEIYTFDEIEGAVNWKTVLNHAPALLQKVEEVKATVSPQQVATIIYTSGTTGTPKGVMLSHENIYTNAMFSKESFPFPDDPTMKVLSFLPLNHILKKWSLTFSFIAE